MRNHTKTRRFRVPAFLLMMSAALSGCSSVMVLDPKGPIAAQQKELILITALLCLLVFIPVMALTAFIVFRYRDRPGNKAPYKPNWSHNTMMEVIWWGIPILIIAVLAVITVRGTYELEPSRAIAAEEETLVVQVTSLDWKWLFQYPEQNVASVNHLYIPEDTPIRFELTSDAPMNSFWIPQLGGQIYTMSGMAMKLHLQADEPGTYFGSAANFSGLHFTDMTFPVYAVSREAFDAWIEEVKASSPELTWEGYERLAQPGTAGKLTFSSFPDGLFESTVTKYAVGGGAHGAHSSH